MIWTLSKTADEPSELTIPTGALWVMRRDNDQQIAIVWPQPRRNDTHNVSALIQRAPELVRAIQQLDIASTYPDTDPDPIIVANAWRTLRRLVFGLEAA
jgi:hypothetical protein